MQDEPTLEPDEREDYVSPEVTPLGTLEELTRMPFSGTGSTASSSGIFPTSA